MATRRCVEQRRAPRAVNLCTSRFFEAAVRCIGAALLAFAFSPAPFIASFAAHRIVR
jgi:hypothetical protein